MAVVRWYASPMFTISNLHPEFKAEVTSCAKHFPSLSTVKLASQRANVITTTYYEMGRKM